MATPEESAHQGAANPTKGDDRSLGPLAAMSLVAGAGR
jgi:hypothetical protein